MTGQEVNVLETVPNGFIVESIFTEFDNDENEYSSEPFFIKSQHVFDNPITEKYESRILDLMKQRNELDSKVASLRLELNQLTNDKKKVEADQKNIIDNLKKNDQLKLVDDFLAGKITHYLEIDYGMMKIVTFNEAVCESNGHRLKLLTLFGTSKGDLHFRLNRYSDGSGGDKKVYPLTDISQAMPIMQAYFDKNIINANGYVNTDLLKSAIANNVSVSDEIIEKATEETKNNLQNRIEKQKLELEKLQLELESAGINQTNNESKNER